MKREDVDKRITSLKDTIEAFESSSISTSKRNGVVNKAEVISRAKAEVEIWERVVADIDAGLMAES